MGHRASGARGAPRVIEAKGKADGLTGVPVVRALNTTRPRGVGSGARVFAGRDPELDLLGGDPFRTRDQPAVEHERPKRLGVGAWEAECEEHQVGRSGLVVGLGKLEVEVEMALRSALEHEETEHVRRNVLQHVVDGDEGGAARRLLHGLTAARERHEFVEHELHALRRKPERRETITATTATVLTSTAPTVAMIRLLVIDWTYWLWVKIVS